MGRPIQKASYSARVSPRRMETLLAYRCRKVLEIFTVMPSEQSFPLASAIMTGETTGETATKEKIISPEPTTFYLTALRLNGRSETPDFYTFLLETGGEMRPLIADGQVIFFTHIDLAEGALGAAGIVAEFKTLSLKNAYLIDVAAALHLLNSENADSSKTIANMLDLFARILTTLGIGVPAVFADTLIELGNYVDTHEFYGDFIEREQMTRARAVDAVRWCLGTIFSVVNLVTRPE